MFDMHYNLIFLIIFLIIFYIISDKLILFIKTNNFLVDNNFIKPQAMHTEKVPALGGLIIYLPMVSFLLFSEIEISYKMLFIFINTIFFIIGLSEDILRDLNPLMRLFLMIIGSLVVLHIYNFNVDTLQISYLDQIFNLRFFPLFFTCVCFLFIINGSNLIDGFNGLLSLHSLLIIILISLTYYLLGHKISELNILVFILIINFLFYNFPKANIFLGDSGSYLIGSILATLTIKLYLTTEISPFFCVILLFFLFYEVIFSFYRRLISGKPVFKPDNLHLHTLMFNMIDNTVKNKIQSNYLTSTVYNLFFLLLIFPSIFYSTNSLLCFFHVLFLFVIYNLVFYKLIQFKKNYHI